MTVAYVEIARHRPPGDAPPPLDERVRSAMADTDVQAALKQMANRFSVKRQVAMAEPGMAELKQRGIEIRRQGVTDLRQNLAQLERSLTELGGHVHHATTAAEAVAIISGIAARHGVRRVVKSKSMAT